MDTTAGAAVVRIFLVGLREGFCRSVARYVEGDPRVTLTGVVPSLALAGMLLPLVRPDLALLNWVELKNFQPDTMRTLRAGCPGLRIVFVTNEAEAYRAATAQAGADAAISQDRFAVELEALLPGLFSRRFASEGRRA
jgi:DNA-binding NarL/FixJ family response regulator